MRQNKLHGLVLLDDNYSTIISAIEEGRRIFDNIRKFVNYLLTCNIGEVITVLLGAILNFQPRDCDHGTLGKHPG